ncbi:MAG: ABC-three component system protein [Ferrovibrio sp.]|uniref:ABC-three component system protein n=1 Tax=Ferrovibrio sp. TaxID=1917215 RepID=UPI003918E9BA
MNDNKHNASASVTGYLYQCRYALLAGLRAIPATPELQLSIEKFDDVAFENAGEPVQLIQTKHHIGSSGSLTNASTDLWKTLLIWANKVAQDGDAVLRTNFLLITTSTAPTGSAASYLGIQGRDESRADDLLIETANTSTNKDNANAYAAYKALPLDIRLALLRAIQILDSSPNISDLYDEIVLELHHAVSRENIHKLAERLEGWWFNIVIAALSGNNTPVSVLAIDQRLDDLREEFKKASLPVDYAGAVPSPEVVAELDKRPFVRQLRKIEIGRSRVEYAIRDFYRASEQRSRWLREDLVDGETLSNYERQLIEAWQPRFASMIEELPNPCDPNVKIQAGKILYKWVETEADFPLRSVRERFLTHGSYHILANNNTVGWHPDYTSTTKPDDSED